MQLRKHHHLIHYSATQRESPYRQEYWRRVKGRRRRTETMARPRRLKAPPPTPSAFRLLSSSAIHILNCWLQVPTRMFWQAVGPCNVVDLYGINDYHVQYQLLQSYDSNHCSALYSVQQLRCLLSLDSYLHVTATNKIYSHAGTLDDDDHTLCDLLLSSLTSISRGVTG